MTTIPTPTTHLTSQGTGTAPADAAAPEAVSTHRPASGASAFPFYGRDALADQRGLKVVA
jgi:hypothetical protein